MYHKTPIHPQAENGVIDLSEWEFTNDQTITLNGEWEFYPSEFLNPKSEHLSASDSQQDFISVPGNWDEFPIDKQINYGTYRLKVIFPDDDDYGIRLKDISSAASIYVNGTQISKVGQPAESASRYKSKLGTYKAFFHAEKNEIEIIAHVAHFENAHEGGITDSISIGTDDAINKEVDLSKTMQFIVAMILIVHSLYAFGLYVMGRGKFQKELIYFGLLLLFASFSILVDEDKLLISSFSINATWSLKLLYLSFAGTVYFILRFIKHVFNLTSPMFRILAIVYGVLTLLLFLLPFQYIAYVGYVIMLLNASSYLFIFVQVLNVIRKGNSDAIYILIATVINLFNVLWGIAINTNMLVIPYYPFDYLIAIMAFAGFLFKRHIRAVRLNEEQSKELQIVDKRKDEFLANTAHELRNPLHGIINIAQVTLNDTSEPLTQKNKENLTLLVQVGQRMTVTLNDLLDISRLSDQKIQLHRKDINLHTVSTGVLDMIHFMTDGKDLQFHLKIPATFPRVDADENRLIQILFNLIHNAVKFTHDGSITIHATHENGIATIAIVDTGIGMNEETLEKLFDPYEQANSSDAFNEGGIGLGLSVCKELVELHGGEIFVESTPHKGSTFFFTLPLAKTVTDTTNQEEVAATIHVDEEKEKLDMPATNLSANKGRVLAVDDDPINLQILKKMLNSQYEIMTATSGKEALKLIEREEWHLVISDAMMPEMSGYELTKKIRQQYTISELPILLLTARSQPEDIYTGFLVGANDYVAKPTDSTELQARVKALTDLRKSFDQQLRLEAAWLQAQIQPHFLSNTLNTIASLGEIDTTRMVKLLHEFGNYLHRSFSVHNTKSFVPLEDEIDLTRSYLFIEKERFGERLRIYWEIEDELDFQIPPLSIQPLVENAVRHGVLKRIDGGKVNIRIREYESNYEMAIIDDGVGMDQEKIQRALHEHPEGIGISNTNRRLIQLYGKGLEIESKLGEGTSVRFTIPKRLV